MAQNWTQITAESGSVRCANQQTSVKNLPADTVKEAKSVQQSLPSREQAAKALDRTALASAAGGLATSETPVGPALEAVAAVSAVAAFAISPSKERALSVLSVGVGKAVGLVYGEVAQHTYNLYATFAEGSAAIGDSNH